MNPKAGDRAGTKPASRTQLMCCRRLLTPCMAAVVAGCASSASGEVTPRRFEIPDVANNDLFFMDCDKNIAVAAAGDMDGDGLPDIAVGLPGDCPLGASGPVIGSCVVISSRDGRVLYKTPVPQSRQSEFAGLGSALCLASDWNDDGRPDLLVGSPSYFGYEDGVVQILSGLDGAELLRWTGANNYDLFGSSLALVGDLDGDGTNEILVGERRKESPGRAVIIAGRDGTVVRHFDGRIRDDEFGCTVAAVGDVNADGVADLMIGAPEPRMSSGYAVVCSGKTGRELLHLRSTTTDNSLFGFSVGSLGDVDGDGHDDVGVGAPWDASHGVERGGDSWGWPGGEMITSMIGGGELFAYSGRTGTLLGSIGGDKADDGIGTAFVRCEDCDGDGIGDLLVPVPGRGEVWLVSGGSMRRLNALKADSGWGTSIAEIGDVDGDGHADFAVASPGHNGQAPAVSLLSGKSLAPPMQEHSDR